MEVAVAKKGEFAPGIKQEKPMSIMPYIDKETIFEFGVHDHTSVKAGRHYDLRLGDKKTGKAYSWAIPKAKLPEPGEQVLAIPTFIHSVKYMDFEGIIGEGYGQGKVTLPHRGKAIIHKASPEMTKFTAIVNGKPNTYILFKPSNFKSAYLLKNITKDNIEKKAQMDQYLPQQQSDIPFSYRYLRLLPYYALGSLGAEYGVGHFAKKYLANSAWMQRSMPRVYKWLMTRQPSAIAALSVGALATGLHAGAQMLRDKWRRFRQ
jgi:hypothetical protein